MKAAAWALALSALAATPGIAADPAAIDWSAVPVTNVTLFYPGQSSYEWWRTAAHPCWAWNAMAAGTVRNAARSRVPCHS